MTSLTQKVIGMICLRKLQVLLNRVEGKIQRRASTWPIKAS
jgi:hypothetical protein